MRVRLNGCRSGRVGIDDGCYEVGGRRRDSQDLDIDSSPGTGEQVSVDSNGGGDNDGSN